MYLEHYGLDEAPFRITPHTDFFFSGANRGATLEALLYAITHDEGIVKISGEVGSGKTMLCRMLMERLPGNVVTLYLANPSLSREDILYALAEELGLDVPENSRAGTVMRLLQDHLVSLYAADKQVVVLIDEAHAMPKESLEEIRLLSNLESNRHKLLQLVLFGQPELDAILARDDMRQLRERITHNFSLEPLVHDDIAQYIDFRMRAAGYRGPNVFTPESLRLIAKASQGLTRRINILADKALLATFAASTHQVGTAEAQAAIKDSGLGAARTSVMRPRSTGFYWALGGALAMLALVGLGRLLAPEPSATPAFPSPASPSSDTLNPSPTNDPSHQEKTDASSTTTPLLDNLLAASQPWLDATDSERWFLQLYTGLDARHPEQVESYLQRALESGLAADQLRVYWAATGDAGRYGVIYGDYASRKEATEALNKLPKALRQSHPYARKASALLPRRNSTQQ